MDNDVRIDGGMLTWLTSLVCFNVFLKNIRVETTFSNFLLSICVLIFVIIVIEHRNKNVTTAKQQAGVWMGPVYCMCHGHCAESATPTTHSMKGSDLIQRFRSLYRRLRMFVTHLYYIPFIMFTSTFRNEPLIIKQILILLHKVENKLWLNVLRLKKEWRYFQNL